MPRKLDPNGGESQHVSKSGYVTRFKIPSSPFQRIIDAAMKRKQLSLREAAKLIDVAPSSLWAWLHHERGVPGPKNFDPPAHIKAMSAKFGIPLADLQSAYEQSWKAQYEERSAGLPPTDGEKVVLDAFADFIEVIESDNRKSINRAKYLRLAKRFYSSAEQEAAIRRSHAPDSKTPPSDKNG